MTIWRKEVYGFLNRKKSRILARLDGLNSSIRERGASSSLCSLQKSLWKELEEILLHEDIMWAQKSRCDWFSFGDKNTRYFHLRANARRRYNRVDAIKDDSGEWIFDEEKIKQEAVSFFRVLFSLENSYRYSLSTSTRFPTISENDIINLGQPVQLEEIEQVVRSMGSLKAPGPDGLNVLFFKTQWSHVKDSVLKFVSHVFDSPQDIRKINQTYLVLIPKVPQPETLRDFRPISLCNVLYKMITKIIANRIKPMLDKVIAPNQSSFVPGRLSSETMSLWLRWLFIH